MNPTKCNIIVFSYNRPRMLRQAIQSILNSTHQNFDIYIMDDGSDFDVWDIANEFSDERISIAKIPPCTPEERISVENTRFPDTANQICSIIPKDEIVLYLCDDDIMHPNWLERVVEGFRKWPSCHVMQGRTFYFYEGEDPLKDGKEGFESYLLDKKTWEEGVFWWNCGSFAILNSCHTYAGGRCDVYWEPGEKEPHSWDIKYIGRVLDAHAMIMGIPEPSVYRREHKDNLSFRLGRLDEEKNKYGLPTKKLAVEMVEGMME